MLVIDTETRHVAPEIAYSKVALIAAQAKRRSIRAIYKKTDSTLRGNIGAELAALGRCWPEAEILYSPGYPSMGRVVAMSRLLINGVPVDQTEFAGIRSTRSAIVRLRSPSGSWNPAVALRYSMPNPTAKSRAQLGGAERPEMRITAGPGALARGLSRAIGFWARRQHCPLSNPAYWSTAVCIRDPYGRQITRPRMVGRLSMRSRTLLIPGRSSAQHD